MLRSAGEYMYQYMQTCAFILIFYIFIIVHVSMNYFISENQATKIVT